MQYETATILLAFFGLASAAPTNMRREVPQEHSHEKFLTSVDASLQLNNPDGITNSVFGLLGNAAAAKGAGKITNLDCLHQATADRAFTNAKAAGNVQGQVDAMIYAAVERNTGSVGLKSVTCTDAAVNPEIQAIKQHQDPASDGAAAANKAITLTLAKQIATLGADPLQALQSGTFAPGKIGDTTGAGNTCDTQDDAEGCIFTKKLLVNDATEADIKAAVAGVSAGAGASADGAAAAGKDAAVPATGTAGEPASQNSDAAAAGKAGKDKAGKEKAKAAKDNAGQGNVAGAGAAQSKAVAGDNVQTFTGALGGAPPAVTKSDGVRPFSVDGSTFVKQAAALQRSCSVQNNACSNAANSGALAGGIAQCAAQEKACNAAAGVAA